MYTPFTLTPSHKIARSNDYSRNLGQSPWKAVILNKVVVGRGYKMKQDNSSLTAAPNGYDSVSLFYFILFEYAYC